MIITGAILRPEYDQFGRETFVPTYLYTSTLCFQGNKSELEETPRI